jgi:homoserine dehydrogenase
MSRFGINPKVVAIVDTGGGVVVPSGVDLEMALRVKGATGSVAGYPGAGARGLRPLDVIREVEAEAVIEATPTNVKDGGPGLNHLEESFKEGKHVITTNKGPLALAFPALLELAAHNGVHLLFSGTVGGGTPILEFGKRCLSTDRILGIRGILNGTTNFILGEMESTGISFEEALGKAQRLGYAEADPTLDVEGWDTACKAVIMANWLMGREVTLRDVHIEGITKITEELLSSAAKEGRSVKLLGTVEEAVSVMPTSVDKKDPLCVHGTLNAVKFVSESAGDEIIVGRGAGGPETASAILRDLLELRERLAGGYRA